MSGRRKSPQARDRILGAHLRAIRLERTALSLERAAEVSQISLASLSRTENGRRHITTEELAALLTLYRVPWDERLRMIDAAHADSPAGWWQGPLPGLPIHLSLASHLATASAVTSWSIAVLPELLQTRDYAIAVLVADGAEPDEAARTWDSRSPVPPIEHTAYLHETALRSPFGGTDALRAQLRHLLDQRSVPIRLVESGTVLGALSHSWLLVEYPADPPVVHVDLRRSGLFLHEAETVPYLRARDELDRAARSPADSRAAIAAAIARL